MGAINACACGDRHTAEPEVKLKDLAAYYEDAGFRTGRPPTTAAHAGRPWRARHAVDSLRLRLIKTAARLIELKTHIKIHLPSKAPDQAVSAVLLDRLPRPGD